MRLRGIVLVSTKLSAIKSVGRVLPTTSILLRAVVPAVTGRIARQSKPQMDRSAAFLTALGFWYYSRMENSRESSFWRLAGYQSGRPN
jgi:hypothetical protein